MKKSDVNEIKKRLKKTRCTMTRMSGCYVNSEKEIILSFNENFLNLEDEELHKYLELANKVLSGKIGNNMLELRFPNEEEGQGGKQQFLMGLKESRLKNDDLLDVFFHLIIDNYDYVGNYLILVFHDAYDVMKKTHDGIALDESEEVYEYLLAAVCPVSLSKAGLGYLEMENRIGSRMRDWVVGVPDAGFVFPAFTERSSDIHSVLYYTKDTKEPHPEFMECILGCPAKQTATEQKNLFKSIVEHAVTDERKRERVLYDIQETIHDMIEEKALYTEPEQEPEPIILTPETIQDVLTTSKINEDIAAKIEKTYTEKFSEEPPMADSLLDNKLLTTGAAQKKEEQLMVEVQRLKDELNVVRKGSSVSNPEGDDNDISSDDTVSTGLLSSECKVVLETSAEKALQIKAKEIDGKRYVMIPLEEAEHVLLNGEKLE